MKKWMAVILTLALVLSFVSMPVESHAADALTITTEEAVAVPGQTIEVQVFVAGNPGIAYLRVTPQVTFNGEPCDTITWEYKESVNGEVFNGDDADFEAGTKNLIWMDPYGTTNEGLLVTLVFQVSQNAPLGEYALNITVREAYDANDEEVAFESEAGSITVFACEHDFKTFHEEQAPGCDTTGSKAHYTCDMCGTAFEEDGVTEIPGGDVTIPAQHTYTTVVHEATCTEGGYTEYICDDCDDSYIADETQPLGHSFTNYIYNNDATCTANGTQTAKCDRCEVTDTQEAPETALGHDYSDATCGQPATCQRCFESTGDPLDHIFTEATCTEAAVCTLCGAEGAPALGHDFGDATCYDPASCSRCGLTTGTAIGHDFVGYTSNNDATCTADGTLTGYCSRCNLPNTIPDEGTAFGHTYSTEWYHDEVYHWYVCVTCDENLSIEQHNFVKLDESLDCTNGGYIYFECACGENYTVLTDGEHHYEDIVVAPSCNEVGYTMHYCTVCTDFYVDTYVEATGHNYLRHGDSVPATCTEEGYVVYECVDCAERYIDILPALGHNWAEWYEFVAPTCTEEGTMRRYCIRCGEVETYQVEALGHSYEAVVTAPTCTEGGFTTYTCATCGDTYVADETDALGHSYELTDSKAPTCTENGYEVYTCANCGDSYTVELVANGHAYEAVVTAPTCTEGGYTTYTCSVCGDGYIADETEALGHNYEAVVTEPTCTEGGYTTYTCANCGDTYVADETEALGHDMGEWYIVTNATCTETGMEQSDCSRCDYFETRELVAYGHAYEAVVTAPTCTEGGYTTYTCPTCGDGYVADETEALGHSYELTDSKEATETEDGYNTFTCAGCGDTYTEVVKATGTNPPTGNTMIIAIMGMMAIAMMGGVMLVLKRKEF